MADYQQLANLMRVQALKMVHRAKSGHLSSSFSIADILAEKLYLHYAFKRMGVNDTYSKKMGNQEYLLKEHSLSVEDIVAIVLEMKR